MVRFQDAIPAVLRVLQGKRYLVLPRAMLLRDPTGLVSVVLPNNAMSDRAWSDLATELHVALEAHSPGEASVLLAEKDLIDPKDILESPDAVPIPGFPNYQLIDRLLTNQEWLRTPLSNLPTVPLATAYSIKGGVGRSTATAVLAWYFARKGKKVLVVDLDLEAPGIASMLLDSMPDFGVVDWLVESLVGQDDASLIEDMLATAPISEGLLGSVQVVAAYGAKTRDYIAKLGRVYFPTLSASGEPIGLAHRLSRLVNMLSTRSDRPDALLLDARAGLHDIGASVVTQLNAEVFMFARNDQQTWDAYRQLFEHIRMSRGISWGMPENDLRWRIKMVAAQLDVTESALTKHVEASYSTWQNLYDDESVSGQSNTQAQVFSRDDESAPHFPLSTFFDTRLRGISFAAKELRPTWDAIEASFAPFLKGAESRLFGTESE